MITEEKFLSVLSSRDPAAFRHMAHDYEEVKTLARRFPNHTDLLIKNTIQKATGYIFLKLTFFSMIFRSTLML